MTARDERVVWTVPGAAADPCGNVEFFWGEPMVGARSPLSSVVCPASEFVRVPTG